MPELEPQLRRATDNRADQQSYLEKGNLEAHIIADMLRIEQITVELKELKDNSTKRFDKIESWIVSGLAVSVTSLILLVGTLAAKLL